MMKTKPVILFFNKFFDSWPELERLDGRAMCDFTTDPARIGEADAVVFHLPRLKGFSALEKRPGQLWVAWSMETPRAYPIMRDPDVMGRFDLRMTYERDADIWVPYLSQADDVDLFRAPPEKTESAPVARFQSNDFDRCGRNRLAALLMTRVKIDSYGTVCNNRTLEGPDRGRRTMLETISRYKFALAFENAIEPDYVSDKFFDPLIAGTVPVYFGTPDVEEFAPGERCFINAADFHGIDELGDYLNYLDADDEAYRAYFAWKEIGLRPSFVAMREKVRGHWSGRLCDILTTRIAGR